ncbi:BQ2448_2380 [Microbotryum intermedium]|uniref:BQ2448_2380 protein n=1 Tax=Microbotryum intermedium TaxID=269621 RepID=A0A238F631_9BASI|nr:BQ2448_2380 [Microbotryum intermedium]
MFLHVLLWICEPGCAACGNGYIFHRPGTAEPDRTVRRHCVPKYTSYQHKTEEYGRDALQKEPVLPIASQKTTFGPVAPCASHPQPTHYTPASAPLQAEIRTD